MTVMIRMIITIIMITMIKSYSGAVIAMNINDNINNILYYYLIIMKILTIIIEEILIISIMMITE